MPPPAETANDVPGRILRATILVRSRTGGDRNGERYAGGGAGMALGSMKVIALEEHYWDPEIAKRIEGNEGRRPEVRRRLDDLGELRLQEMDEARIDVQVLSQGAPSLQRLEASEAVPLARQANDHLFESVQEHPDRFAGFAVLPTADPEA